MESLLDEEKIDAYRMMAYGIDNGMAILDVLDVGVVVVDDDRLKEAFRSIKEGIRCGGTISSSIEDGKYTSLFHRYEINAFKEGEENGDIEVVMSGLVERLKSE